MKNGCPLIRTILHKVNNIKILVLVGKTKVQGFLFAFEICEKW